MDEKGLRSANWWEFGLQLHVLTDITDGLRDERIPDENKSKVTAETPTHNAPFCFIWSGGVR